MYYFYQLDRKRFRHDGDGLGAETPTGIIEAFCGHCQGEREYLIKFTTKATQKKTVIRLTQGGVACLVGLLCRLSRL
jgi:hypothetical protein